MKRELIHRKILLHSNADNYRDSNDSVIADTIANGIGNDNYSNNIYDNTNGILIHNYIY